MAWQNLARGIAPPLFALLVSSAASAAPVLVDCGAPGQTLTAALEAGETEIEFTGTCAERIEIERDDISISGASGDRTQDVVLFGLDMRGAHNVRFRGFTIGGTGTAVFDGSVANFSNMVLAGLTSGAASKAVVEGSLFRGIGEVAAINGGHIYIQSSPVESLGNGISVLDGSVIYITSSDIENTNDGIQVSGNSRFTILAGRVGPALSDDPRWSCNPLCIRDGSSALIDDTTIEGANDDPAMGGAVTVSRGSSLSIIGNASISNSGSQPALGVYEGSRLRMDRTNGLGSSLAGGFRLSGKSFADIRAGSVTGAVEVRLDSLLHLGAGGIGSDPAQLRVTGNTTLAQDSHLVVADPAVTIDGDVECLDRRSRLSGSYAGTGSIVSCRDFNNRKLAR